jgi:hypothetical protein
VKIYLLIGRVFHLENSFAIEIIPAFRKPCNSACSDRVVPGKTIHRLVATFPDTGALPAGNLSVVEY